jgi:hypothetical protein
MKYPHLFIRWKTNVIRNVIFGIILACSWTVDAQSNVSVSSTTDGNGLFSYTFNLNDSSPYVWGLNDTEGDLQIPSYGILNIISPPGWAATVDSNDIITWQPTSSDWVYLGQPPLTFSVQSSSTVAVPYDQIGEPGDTYIEGGVAGTLCTASDHVGVAGGFERFSFLGPQEVPEPSTYALFAFAILLAAPRAFTAGRSLFSKEMPIEK